MRHPIAPAIVCASALLAVSCAAPGSYPSLAPRPAEAIYAAGDPERVPVPAPDDPSIPVRLQALLEAGRAGDTGFGDAIARARTLAGQAGAPGSDSWVEAQQALSRAETGRAGTARALADLDAFAVERARQGPLSTGDAERMATATASLQAIADRQQAQLDAVAGMLRR